MKDDKTKLPREKGEYSKIESGGKRSWIPDEAMLMFASLIHDITYDQVLEESSSEDVVEDGDETGRRRDEMPGVAKEFHWELNDGALRVGEVGTYDVMASGDGPVVWFREKFRERGE